MMQLFVFKRQIMQINVNMQSFKKEDVVWII